MGWGLPAISAEQGVVLSLFVLLVFVTVYAWVQGEYYEGRVKEYEKRLLGHTGKGCGPEV